MSLQWCSRTKYPRLIKGRRALNQKRQQSLAKAGQGIRALHEYDAFLNLK